MRRSVKIRAFFCLFALLPLQNSGASLRECPGARWISTAEEGADCPNSWIAFRRDVELKALPAVAPVCIAADTKYWLWINGECVVFEGGLKRGPTPGSTYYDRVDIAPFLRKGTNRIAVLLWHFGKDGFSHKDSGRAGLLFSATGKRFSLRSDSLWLCRIHPAFGDTGDPRPNFRLAESNIRFDARRDIGPWQTAALSDLEGFRNAREIGRRGDAPWGGLVERPIPQWKDFGVREARFERFSAGETDSVIVRLPYNMQMTPVITLDDPQGGSPVGISTDHSFAGGTSNIRAEYVTRRGVDRHRRTALRHPAVGTGLFRIRRGTGPGLLSGCFDPGADRQGHCRRGASDRRGAALAACDRSGGHDGRRHAAAGSCRAASGRTISVGRSAARRGEIPETGTYPAEPDFRGLSNRIGVRSGAGWSAGVRILK